MGPFPHHAVKSQIYIALINYLLLQLIVRTVATKRYAFSNIRRKLCMHDTHNQILSHLLLKILQ